jgi:hypothetical protein
VIRWCDIDDCRTEAVWRLVSYPDNVVFCDHHRWQNHPAGETLEWPDERIERLPGGVSR